MDRIRQKLDELGWTIEQLLVHLDRALARREKNRIKCKKYFEKNRKSLYEYHKKWRREHPEYTKQKRQRERDRARTS